MEKITDFFKDIRDRLSNPLFSSFIISWLIINWQIPVAFSFYNNETLKNDGYNSYMDLILSKWSGWNYFGYPLLLALIYTFVFPFIRNGVFAFQTWIRTWGNDLNLKISKKGKVSTERYVQLREKYNRLTKTLEELLSQETTFVQENSQLKAEKVQLTTQNNNLSTDLSRWQTMNDSRILNGEWDYVIKSNQGVPVKNFRLTIQSNNAYTYTDAAKRNLIENYNIQDFFCNPVNSRLCFTLHPTKEAGKAVFHNLQFPNGISDIFGTEDDNFLVFYKKLRE